MEIKVTFDEETLSTLHTLAELADSITRFTEARPSEILPLEGDVDSVEEPKIEEPKIDEPKIEEPKIDEPKVEEPKEVEESKEVEEPKEVEESKEVEEPKEVAEPTVTIKDIQRLGASIIQADPHKREEVVAVLTTVGQSKKVSDINPSLFDNVYQALKEIE